TCRREAEPGLIDRVRGVGCAVGDRCEPGCSYAARKVERLSLARELHAAECDCAVGGTSWDRPGAVAVLRVEDVLHLPGDRRWADDSVGLASPPGDRGQEDELLVDRSCGDHAAIHVED